MSIAIIAEYNPFHNGHKYQIEYVKKNFPNDEIIIIMSGKYVQRGELAIASFEQRAAAALAAGADRVIELPFEYATQAAHIFAQGAMKIVAENKIDKLIFGSESNDINALLEIAEAIYYNEERYNSLLKANLKKGASFPNSAAAALQTLLGKSITMPNDILGLEYVKAIVFNNYPIKVYSLSRTIAFDASEPQNQFASASLLRKMIFNQEDISNYSPMRFTNIPDRIENYYPQFQTIIKNTPACELAQIQLVSEGMENLFKKHIDAPNYETFVNRANSKRYTSSRIKRVMLYILLGIKK